MIPRNVSAMDQSETAVISKKARTRIGNKNDIVGEGFIHLAPRTHDASLAGEHIPSITYLAKDLQASVQAVWPRRHEFRYSTVQVLLLSWEDDDLGVAKEVVDLQNVFEDLYHYEVQVYRIPNLKPDKALKRRMLEFLENDGEETLLVLYYGGHARKNPQTNEAPIWFANRKPKSPSLPSGGVQSLMEEADSDALLLYDCCNAAATTTSEAQQDQTGVTEVIAACGYEAIAPEVGEHSFTNALMETLAAASKGVPYSVGELHNRILSRLKCWVPSLVKDKNGKMKEDVSGKLEYERQPRRTPIYSILCESKPRRSILLAPLQNHPTTRSMSSARSVPDLNEEENTPKASRKRKISSSPGTENDKCSQVILSIQLCGDELDIPAWKECIRLFPPEAKDIRIEGIYESFSTLLLLRMPVAVWNLLPKNPAYSFVGYVTSENQATAELLENLYGEANITSISSRSHRSGDASPAVLPKGWMVDDAASTSAVQGSPMSQADDDWSHMSFQEAPTISASASGAGSYRDSLSRAPYGLYSPWLGASMDYSLSSMPYYNTYQPEQNDLYFASDNFWNENFWSPPAQTNTEANKRRISQADDIVWSDGDKMREELDEMEETAKKSRQQRQKKEGE